MDYTIDAERCTLCGLCRLACPMKLFEPGDARMRFVKETPEFCIRCGHCVAVCPEDAISIENLAAETPVLVKERSARWDAFQELLLSRRSVRAFKDRDVEKELLNKIVESVSTAPTGESKQSVTMTVLKGRHTIEPMIEPMIAFYRKFHSNMKSRIGRPMMRFMLGRDLFAAMDGFMPVMERMFDYYDTTGQDPITWGAPLLMLFHASRTSISGTHDAVIACTYAMLAAHALGLGTTVIGMVPPYLERNRQEKENLGIPPNSTVHLSLIAGHPQHEYTKGIRRPLQVDWIE